ncbi:MAG: hypothetical protein WA645_10480 [Pseudolabrys sp.]
MNASGVEMSGTDPPSRTTTPVTVATKVDHGVGHDETQLHQFCDCRFRQDYEIGVFAVFDPLAQGACRSEIEVQLVARIALKFGAEC